MLASHGLRGARAFKLTRKLCGIWKWESAALPNCLLLSSPLFRRQIPLRLRNLGLDIDWIGDGERREGEVN